MNPAIRLDQLLEDSGAIPIRVKTSKHKLYRLPGGTLHTAPKTPSDPRSLMNNLAQLRRAIRSEAVVVAPKAAPVSPPPYVKAHYTPPPLPEPEPEPQPVAAVEPASDVIPPRAPDTPFADRVAELIAAGEAEETDLMERTEAVSKQLTFLRMVQQHVTMPHTEALISLLLPPPVLPPPVIVEVPAAAPAPPPPQYTLAKPHLVSVTKDGVRQVIQGIAEGEEFTVHDIEKVLVNGQTIGHVEGLRVRGSISSALKAIYEQDGSIDRLNPGRGRALGIWRKRVGQGRNVVLESPNQGEVTTEVNNDL